MDQQQKDANYGIQREAFKSCQTCDYYSEMPHRIKPDITIYNCRLLVSKGSHLQIAPRMVCYHHKSITEDA